MKVRTGMLVTIRDSAGNQVFGLDSQFAADLVARHGECGAYTSSLGSDLTIEIVAYTDHQSRFALWKQKLQLWLTRRQLAKRLRKSSKILSRAERGPSALRITTLRHPTGADFQSPLTSSSPPAQMMPPSTSDTIKPAAGSRDDDTSLGESFKHDVRNAMSEPYHEQPQYPCGRTIWWGLCDSCKRASARNCLRVT